jgi:hypothetical protein
MHLRAKPKDNFYVMLWKKGKKERATLSKYAV